MVLVNGPSSHQFSVYGVSFARRTGSIFHRGAFSGSVWLKSPMMNRDRPSLST